MLRLVAVHGQRQLFEASVGAVGHVLNLVHGGHDQMNEQEKRQASDTEFQKKPLLGWLFEPWLGFVDGHGVAPIRVFVARVHNARLYLPKGLKRKVRQSK
jgi:hypothetical protein